MSLTTIRPMPTERHLEISGGLSEDSANCSKQGSSRIGASFLFWHVTCNLHPWLTSGRGFSCARLGELFPAQVIRSSHFIGPAGVNIVIRSEAANAGDAGFVPERRGVSCSR